MITAYMMIYIYIMLYNKYITIYIYITLYNNNIYIYTYVYTYIYIVRFQQGIQNCFKVEYRPN